MTNDQIAELFDLNPNMTLAQLSRITGKSVEQLKKILMGE
jgi:DNA-binding CsgD family transcriptional regulator